MDTHNCQFCGHSNPTDSKYCSECGGCLYLVPCASCGAINDVKAVACYQCHTQLQAGKVDGLDHASPVTVIAKPGSPDILSRALDIDKLDPAYALTPAADVPQPFYRRHVRTLAATATIAGVAVLGFFGYRYYSPLDKAQPTAAGGDPHASASASSAASTGTIRSGTAAVAPLPTKPTTTSGTAATAAATAAVTPPAPAVVNETQSAAIGAINVRGDDAGKSGKVAPQQGCSEASAALGLCAPSQASTVSAVPPVTHTMRKE